MKEPFKFSDLQETELHILLTPLALAKRNNAIERIEQIVSEQIISSREDVELGEGEATKSEWDIAEKAMQAVADKFGYESLLKGIKERNKPSNPYTIIELVYHAMTTYAAPFQAEIERLKQENWQKVADDVISRAEGYEIGILKSELTQLRSELDMVKGQKIKPEVVMPSEEWIVSKIKKGAFYSFEPTYNQGLKIGWNECLSELRRLNPTITFTELPSTTQIIQSQDNEVK
jgi:hypothetical protein